MAILTMAILTMKVDLISLSVGGPDYRDAPFVAKVPNPNPNPTPNPNPNYRDAPFVAKVRELAAAWLGLEG